MEKELEIMFLYRSKQGREVKYNTLFCGEDVMDFEDYEPIEFWQTMGGIEITVDGFKTIFRSTNFYVIEKPVTFILHSLYKLRGIKSDWFDQNEDLQLSVRTTSNEVFQIKFLENETLSISFLPLESKQSNKRGVFYFNDVVIKSEIWYAESEKALREYFQILSEIVGKNPNSPTARLMKEYHGVYERLNL